MRRAHTTDNKKIAGIVTQRLISKGKSALAKFSRQELSAVSAIHGEAQGFRIVVGTYLP